MRRTPLDRTMRIRAPALAMLCAMAVGGCVSTETHTKTLNELEAAKKTSAQLEQQLAEVQLNLDQEAAQRKAAEQQAAELAKEREALAARSSELNSELGNVRGQITDLEQKLASGSASAGEEIAKLQKQASELEANAARTAKEREQLRQEQSQLAATLEQERLAKEEEIEIPVQINGKLRSRLLAPADAEEEFVRERALADEKVRAALNGKQVDKLILVPGKLVNVVIR